MFTVLHTESSKGWGGQENRTLHECIGLKELGARVVILCQPGSTLGERAASKGIEVRFRTLRKSYDIGAIYSIVKLIKAEGIDVVSTHSGRDSLLAGIAGRLSGKRPVIVRTRHLALPITSRVTYSLLPHKVVTVSEYVRQYLIKEGVPARNVIAIPTGVDNSAFDPGQATSALREELGLGQDTPLIGTIAILRYRKGHHILLEAIPRVIREIPKAVFVFAGDGPQEENIRSRIQSLGLSDNVVMLGLRKDIPDILKSLDLFVLPTLQEALGTSFLEAMAMGKPVIGTAVGGVVEVIQDGLNGYLVQPDNPPQLAEAILKVLLDKEGAARMGREGREIALQKYTVERMQQGMYALYASLLGERAS